MTDLTGPLDARRRAPRGKLSIAWIAFFIFLVLPLYVIATIVAIRSDLFASSRGLSDEQLRALWTFIGAGLAAAATVLGAIIAMSHNNRTLTLQHEAEARKTT